MAKITVRLSEPKDAQALQEIYAGKAAYSGTLLLPFSSKASWQSRMENIPDNIYSFVAEYESRVVGNLGFELYQNPRRRHAGTFGMAVRDDFQSKGVGSALLAAMLELTDNWLNVRRIEITVFTDNHPAMALYEKFGFTVEGESKDYAFRQGEYASVYHMARIKQHDNING
ncbi:GNAT family N-acetyltransferase [Photobacterium atrarenae]|uniref:GNAT family N-acetyltransferase n=1 Tax=Photobacterium atrarenae TaxID=865757 RepID=A0ABY5GKD4_9GAMM|nr:GNAT family N-acetyltransferase [Photobacterium atrarenae]UTV29646.1 GNAT family N-acetyltransferase [Photobacterium atrarenae]